MVSISLCFSLFYIWLSITAEEITKLLEDIIIFLSSKPDEFSMSRMHEKVPKETGLQEINENMEKQGRTKKGRYFTYSHKNEGRSAIFVEATALL